MNRNPATAIAAAAILALSIAPLAVVAEELPNCSDKPREEEVGKDIDNPVDFHVLLNLVDDEPGKLGVWENANTLRGLQTEEWTCEESVSGDVNTYSPDAQVAPAASP